MTAPGRGEIWFVQLPTDPPEKGRRPALVVSAEMRNRAAGASTVLIVPLSTTPPKAITHIQLLPGETGLAEASTARCEDITTVRKAVLVEPHGRLRRLSETRLRQIAAGVQAALGFPLQ